jgi:hypothetical protein
MTPALLLVALSGATAPIAPEPFPSCQTSIAAMGDILHARYGESIIGAGETPSEMVAVYVSERGTWTLVIIAPDGRACVGAAGEGWRFAPKGEPA